MSGLFTKGRNTPGNGRGSARGGRPRIWLPQVPRSLGRQTRSLFPPQKSALAMTKSLFQRL
jgi:hypothetical protein